MYDLIKLNNYTMPEMGGFTLSEDSIKNIFEADSGKRTIEIVKSGIHSISCKYDGLMEATVNSICEILANGTVTAVFHNPLNNTQTTKNMEVSGVSTSKNHYKNDLSNWSLSFDLDDLCE